MNDQTTSGFPSAFTFGGPSGAICSICGTEVAPHEIHACGMVTGPELLVRRCDECGATYHAASRHRCPLPAAKKRSMPMIGYRAWTGGMGEYSLGVGPEPQLHSLGVGYVWQPGRQPAASCMEQKLCQKTNGVVPDPRCDCGYWVLSSLDLLQPHVAICDELLVGAVMCWGRIVRHGSEGWRTQYAEPLALLDMKLGPDNDRKAQDVSRRYNLPIYERKALELIVREYGDTLVAKDTKERAR